MCVATPPDPREPLRPESVPIVDSGLYRYLQSHRDPLGTSTVCPNRPTRREVAHMGLCGQGSNHSLLRQYPVSVST